MVQMILQGSALEVRLSGPFTLDGVEALAKAVKDSVDRPLTSVTFNVEAVETVDITFFQVITAFQRSMRPRCGQISLAPVPEDHAVLAAAQRLGVPIDRFFPPPRDLL